MAVGFTDHRSWLGFVDGCERNTLDVVERSDLACTCKMGYPNLRTCFQVSGPCSLVGKWSMVS